MAIDSPACFCGIRIFHALPTLAVLISSALSADTKGGKNLLSTSSTGMRPVVSRPASFYGIAILLFLCSADRLHAQINTEAMRRDDLAPGLHHRIGVDLEYQAGNTNFLSVGTSYRLDFLEGRFNSFLVARYDRRSSGEILNKNEGFAHIRSIYIIDSVVRAEAFVQKEFNDFIRLRDRNVAGGGVRLRPFVLRDSTVRMALFVGIGGMYESEWIAVTPERRTRLFRSTNYLTMQGRFGPVLTTTLTGYYQIAPAAPGDFRILAEGEVSLRISDVVSFILSSRYRYDNQPPDGIRNYDIRLKNGVTVTF